MIRSYEVYRSCRAHDNDMEGGSSVPGRKELGFSVKSNESPLRTLLETKQKRCTYFSM